MYSMYIVLHMQSSGNNKSDCFISNYRERVPVPAPEKGAGTCQGLFFALPR